MSPVLGGIHSATGLSDVMKGYGPSERMIRHFFASRRLHDVNIDLLLADEG